MPDLDELDPFDLPDWLGTGCVTWQAREADRTGFHVRGVLRADDPGRDAQEQPCDLLAVDQAYPVPVVGEETRRHAHQAWRNGQVLLVAYDGTPALAVPGTGFAADRIVDVVGRLARAVGARPDDYVVALRLGVVRRDE
ncbi:hypothetical protein EKO23_18435 [Nocardioides guangzhouensis]|uniref:Uncharacterized protein n=1 Tax=Nocardioides guangzhouensis TaxID=2497878 RepID=A0A4Q4Z761_9ACTN|nr:hypothetical protein [Nocardioides guangzhouensis]RYP83593.1 hypothetical protein EKO23_18435 [Nocardioides guangzhouensis]